MDKTIPIKLATKAIHDILCEYGDTCTLDELLVLIYEHKDCIAITRNMPELRWILTGMIQNQIGSYIIQFRQRHF